MYDNDSFFYKIKRTVYKWWCVIYQPVYKLTHKGFSSAAAQTPDDAEAKRRLAEQMAKRIGYENQYHIDTLVNTTEELKSDSASDTVSDAADVPTDYDDAPEIDTSNVDSDVMSRANEIMERLAREAAEDEAKKQAEIAAARKKADEDARLAEILKSTQIDISQYIEEGKASHKE